MPLDGPWPKPSIPTRLILSGFLDWLSSMGTTTAGSETGTCIDAMCLNGHLLELSIAHMEESHCSHIGMLIPAHETNIHFAGYYSCFLPSSQSEHLYSFVAVPESWTHALYYFRKRSKEATWQHPPFISNCIEHFLFAAAMSPAHATQALFVGACSYQ